MPLVTVAVPVHNGARTLQKCLESLASQTCSSYKVIVFENASTDETRKIAEDFAKSDSRFEVRPSSSFLTGDQNFSRAIAEAARNSRYFCLRAADDYSSGNFLEALSNALTSHPEVTLAVSNVGYLEPDGREYIPKRHAISEFNSQANSRYKGLIFPGSWYYGIYRSDRAPAYLLDTFLVYPYGWGADRLLVYKMIADLGIVFVPTATFYCQVGSDSHLRYAPKSFTDAVLRRWSYYNACMDMDFHKNFIGFIDAFHSRWHAWKIAGRHTGTRAKQLARLAFGVKKKVKRI